MKDVVISSWLSNHASVETESQSIQPNQVWIDECNQKSFSYL